MMVPALGLHILAALVWVGGMFFAYVCLRPSVPGIEPPPERLKLWRRVFQRFFPWVWASIVVLLATGNWMILGHFGGFKGAGVHIHAMYGLGLLMMLLFAHLYFAEWRRFAAAVDGGDGDTARGRLERIRRTVAINLVLGLIVSVIGATGRYWAG
jgi:uncharacterized membrane protein